MSYNNSERSYNSDKNSPSTPITDDDSSACAAADPSKNASLAVDPAKLNWALSSSYTPHPQMGGLSMAAPEQDGPLEATQGAEEADEGDEDDGDEYEEEDDEDGEGDSYQDEDYDDRQGRMPARSNKKRTRRASANDTPVDDEDSPPVGGGGKGRKKIRIEYIEKKDKRFVSFSKRKAGILKKAYELATLTGTDVLLLVVSENDTMHSFGTKRFLPFIKQKSDDTETEAQQLISRLINSEPPAPRVEGQNGVTYSVKARPRPTSSESRDTRRPSRSKAPRAPRVVRNKSLVIDTAPEDYLPTPLGSSSSLYSMNYSFQPSPAPAGSSNGAAPQFWPRQPSEVATQNYSLHSEATTYSAQFVPRSSVGSQMFDLLQLQHAQQRHQEIMPHQTASTNLTHRRRYSSHGMLEQYANTTVYEEQGPVSSSDSYPSPRDMLFSAAVIPGPGWSYNNVNDGLAGFNGTLVDGTLSDI